MAEFGVAATLDIKLDEQSKRQARKEIQEMGDISLPVEVQGNQPSQQLSNQPSRGAGTGNRLDSHRNKLLRDLDGIGDDLVGLAETRNWYLEEMLDSVEGGIGAGGGDDGGMLRPRRPSGGEGVLGLLGGAIGSLALLKSASDSTSEGETGDPAPIPVEDPGEIPYGGPNPIPVATPYTDQNPVPVEEPGTVPVQDPGEVTVKKPSWVPIPVQSPGETPSPTPSPGPSPTPGRPSGPPTGHGGGGDPAMPPVPNPQPGRRHTPGQTPLPVINPDKQPDGSQPGTGQGVGWVERLETAAAVPVAMTGAALGGATGMKDETAADVAIGATALGGAGALFGPGAAAGLGTFATIMGGAAGESSDAGREPTSTDRERNRTGNRAHSARQERQSANVTVNQEVRLDPSSMRELERKLEQQKRDILQEVRREFGVR